MELPEWVSIEAIAQGLVAILIWTIGAFTLSRLWFFIKEIPRRREQRRSEDHRAIHKRVTNDEYRMLKEQKVRLMEFRMILWIFAVIIMAIIMAIDPSEIPIWFVMVYFPPIVVIFFALDRYRTVEERRNQKARRCRSELKDKSSES